MIEFLNDSQIWLLFSFLIFAFIVFKFGKSAVIAMLDGRIETIKTELETAENLRVEAQELLAQYQRKQRDAEQEAETIIAKAEQHALEIRKTAEKELNETLQRREQQMKDRLTQMQENVLQEIRKHAANLSVQATAQIIAENIDKKVGEQLIDSAVKSAGKSLH